MWANLQKCFIKFGKRVLFKVYIPMRKPEMDLLMPEIERLVNGVSLTAFIGVNILNLVLLGHSRIEMDGNPLGKSTWRLPYIDFQEFNFGKAIASLITSPLP
jgi:hypothetical protein